MSDEPARVPAPLFPPPDTTPNLPKPRADEIDAAAIDLPRVLWNMPSGRFPGAAKPPSDQRLVRADELMNGVVAQEHGPAAAAWTIHRAVGHGRLLPEVRNRNAVVGHDEHRDPDRDRLYAAMGWGDAPPSGVSIRSVPRPTAGPSGPIPFDCLLVRSTPAFWGPVPEPPPPAAEADAPPLGSPAHPITLNHIGAMVESERAHGRFEERYRAMVLADSRGGAMDVSTARTIACWAAANRPQVARLTKPVAATLPVYRWLVRTARKEYGSDLTPEVLLMIVGEVATQTGRRSEELFDLPLDGFDALRAGLDCPPGHTPPPTAAAAPEGQPPARTGGKRGTGRKATDPIFDKRVRAAWDTRRYATYADLAGELGCQAKDIRASLDRSRKWPEAG